MLHINNKRIVVLINSFRDAWLEAYFIEDIRSKKIPASIDDRLFRKLQLIDDAESDLDLRVPPGNHFERLSGNLKGKHSIRVNKQWPLIFEWVGGEGKAVNIYLDKHEYK
ncbi:MAG: type II toxin-antitoxin system RelE/ParE family toxin [Thiotrichaceae bacterium]|nr:type II toxin-antitoxin system RelE/ParE family toxin [Thiotrichaceae bacterium]